MRRTHTRGQTRRTRGKQVRVVLAKGRKTTPLPERPKQNRVRLVLEGMANEGGHVRAADLQRELQLLLNFLQKAEEATLRGKDGSVYYVVTALRHDSPATIELEARPTSLQHDHREEILSNASRLVAEVRAGKLRRKVDTAWLGALRDMAAPVGKTVAAAEVSFNGTSLPLGNDIRKQVVKIIAPEETAPGTIAGMLEVINIHADANRFWIYPDLGPAKVRCDFAPVIRQRAIESVGQFVEVKGLLRYKTTAPFPHAIHVEELVPLPQDDLPKADDIRGIAEPPDGMEGLSSEEIVSRIRNAVR